MLDRTNKFPKLLQYTNYKRECGKRKIHKYSKQVFYLHMIKNINQKQSILRVFFVKFSKIEFFSNIFININIQIK